VIGVGRYIPRGHRLGIVVAKVAHEVLHHAAPSSGRGRGTPGCGVVLLPIGEESRYRRRHRSWHHERWEAAGLRVWREVTFSYSEVRLGSLGACPDYLGDEGGAAGGVGVEPGSSEEPVDLGA